MKILEIFHDTICFARNYSVLSIYSAVHNIDEMNDQTFE